MSSLLESEILSVCELLAKPNLTIPSYQRPYKWTHRHINQLFQDIEINKDKSAYRLGTIVFHEEIKPDAEYLLNIVDGQQRTLTLVLIIRAILDFRLKDIERKVLKDKLENLEKILSNFIANQKFENDISKFNLHQNYQEIKRLVSRSEFTEQHVDFVLNKCQIVTFTLRSISEAFQFFDSQNSRGRDLEPHDLLKAYHLREFDDSEADLKLASVAYWEELESEEISRLFAKYLFRIRQWSRGESARYFSKSEVDLFKGVNLNRVGHYPYVQSSQIVHHFVDDYNKQYQRKIDGQHMIFPFHLDQIIINGRRFFEMVKHYHNQIDQIIIDDFGKKNKIGSDPFSASAVKILNLLNSYDARHRTGDKYIRSIFDCLLIYYIDKFGHEDLSRAIEKIFIWAFSLRIKQQVVQLATMDNYVLANNFFQSLKESTKPSDFINIPLNTISESENKNNKPNLANQDPLVILFKEMKYYE